MNYEKEFWDSSEQPNPKLTEEMIKRAENELNLKLPDLLIKLLRIQNGGYTKGFIFPSDKKTSWAEGYVPFDELLGIGFNGVEGKSLTILESTYLTQEWGLPDKQIILSGDGHWWITLDYRENENEPAVSWIDTEMGQDLKLTDTFDDFIKRLVSREEFQFE